MALITTMLAAIITIDDDASYHRLVFQRNIRRKDINHPNRPGVMILEIDGLSKNVLNEAMDGGYMPTLSRWIKEDSHRLIGWETDLSSQTGASQAGILHGE